MLEVTGHVHIKEGEESEEKRGLGEKVEVWEVTLGVDRRSGDEKGRGNSKAFGGKKTF